MVMDTQEYACVLEVFFELLGVKRDIIMGHSFGGKVATVLNPTLLVLLSTAGITLPKPLSVQVKIKMTKIANALGFGAFSKLFRAKDAQNLNQIMYETFKKVVDEDFSSRFENFNNKALICWGEDDTATPLIAGEKIHSLMQKSRFTSYQGDHFFFMQRSKAISTQISEEYLK